MDRPLAMFVVGTRPDAIKTAPVVQEFLRYDSVETLLVSTGQHREMLAQALGAFDLRADIDLDVMQHGQSLSSLTARVIEGLDRTILARKPSMVFAQGDTTSTFVAGLVSFYWQIPFAHVEAGLRTETVWNPFPEEFNRRAVGLFAALHFPPTNWAAQNLLKEGVDPTTVFVTGNTGIDAVRLVAASHSMDWYPEHSGRVVVLTTHRRENWGEPQERIARAALDVVEKNPDVLLVVPMHRNPAVRELLTRVLGASDRIHLIEPPEYADFVKLMQRASLILTDSGGVQEEAPTFGVPVLVLRDTTERPEGVEAGTAKLVGTDLTRIVAESCTLLQDKSAHERMAKAVSPYGDGKAAARIRSVVFERLGVPTTKEAMWT
jgi:UDP-N-acetylglucosamine 2-epimerase (non-hydrolysing)